MFIYCFQFVKFTTDNPKTVHGGYDNKALLIHEDDIKMEKPVMSVYNGSPNYVMGADYEKTIESDTILWANEILTQCILSWLFYTLYTIFFRFYINIEFC